MSLLCCVMFRFCVVVVLQQRQMQLMCDILVSDKKSSSSLNDEQKSLLATFENKNTNVTMQRSCKRYRPGGPHRVRVIG